MGGDSLLFQQIRGACMGPLATNIVPAGQSPARDWKEALIALPTREDSSFPEVNLADEALTPGHYYSCDVPLPGNSTLTFAYYAEPKPPHHPEALEKMRAKVGRDPDVLYFDAGMHYLQMLTPKSADYFEVDKWISPNFENALGEFLSHPFVKKTPKVVFFEGHSICEEKYIGDYAAIASALKGGDQNTTMQCVDRVQGCYDKCLDRDL